MTPDRDNDEFDNLLGCGQNHPHLPRLPRPHHHRRHLLHQGLVMNDDRRVHASHPDWEIVRYNRAGKWYVEWRATAAIHPGTKIDAPLVPTVWPNNNGRSPLSVRHAARIAATHATAVHKYLTGGNTFDRLVEELGR